VDLIQLHHSGRIGNVGYHPAIPTSSLLKQTKRKPGAIHQPHFTVDCRAFKER
jgi:hypothetical protein